MAVKKEKGEGSERLQSLAKKARTELEKMLKIIGEEASLSSRFIKGKIDILGINTEIEKKYKDLGKESYNLISSGKITEPGLKAISSEIDLLYNKANKRKEEIEKLKTQIKKTPNFKD
jgi:hypothetical protein